MSNGHSPAPSGSPRAAESAELAGDFEPGESSKTLTSGGAGAAGSQEWLLLVYRVPSEPTRLRATVWRRLKGLGAVYLQNSAAALPAGTAAERALRKLRHEIVDMGGTAVLLNCSALAGEAEVLAAFQAARDDEYEEIIDKCQDFMAGLEKEYKAEHFTYAELEENEEDLAKLRTWLAKITVRDVFGAPKRAATLEAVDTCERALEEYAARVYAEEGEGQ